MVKILSYHLKRGSIEILPGKEYDSDRVDLETETGGVKEMEIGEVIRKYRREAGLTQEEMAQWLGVTAPAVNKWENNHTQPDISLLAPIARLFGITTDTLLSYQESLTAQEIRQYVKELDEELDRNGFEAGFLKAKRWASQYPNCIQFLWQAATILDARLALGMEPEEKGKGYEETLNGWLERCLGSEDEQVRKQAAGTLFYRWFRREEYEKALSFLSVFPKDDPERRRKEALVYAKTGKTTEACQILEGLLFSGCQFASLVLTNLRLLYMEEGDHEMAWKLVRTQSELAALFEMGRYHEVNAALDVATWEKDEEATERVMREILESIGTMGDFTRSSLYRHMSFGKMGEDLAEKLKASILEGMKEETFAYMAGNPFWEEIVHKADARE